MSDDFYDIVMGNGVLEAGACQYHLDILTVLTDPGTLTRMGLESLEAHTHMILNYKQQLMLVSLVDLRRVGG